MRRKNDFYPTPEWATKELLQRVEIMGCVLECCAGANDIARPLAGNARKLWTNDYDFITMEEQTVSLDTLGQGVAIEKFHDELTRVLENILDPNTKPTAKREVILKVSFRPDEDRSFAHTIIETSSKLAPTKPVGTAIYIGRQHGKPIATERDTRQLKLPEDNVMTMKGGAQ